jgi:hypothetical protein
VVVYSKEEVMIRWSALVASILLLALLGCQKKVQPPSDTDADSTDRTGLDRLATEEPGSGLRLPKGAKAVAVTLAKGQEFPKGAMPGKAVDLVGEISEPSKTGLALLNVILLAVDSGRERGDKRPWVVTVALTPAQVEGLLVMQKHRMELRLKLREKEKSKR